MGASEGGYQLHRVLDVPVIRPIAGVEERLARVVDPHFPSELEPRDPYPAMRYVGEDSVPAYAQREQRRNAIGFEGLGHSGAHSVVIPEDLGPRGRSPVPAQLVEDRDHSAFPGRGAPAWKHVLVATQAGLAAHHPVPGRLKGVVDIDQVTRVGGPLVALDPV